jgi:hypothetical protein
MLKFRETLLALLFTSLVVFENNNSQRTFIEPTIDNNLIFCNDVEKPLYGPLRDSIKFEELKKRKFKHIKKYFVAQGGWTYKDYHINKNDNISRYREIFKDGKDKPFAYITDLNKNGKFDVEEILLDRAQDGLNGNERPFYKEFKKILEKTRKKEFKI